MDRILSKYLADILSSIFEIESFFGITEWIVVENILKFVD